MVQFRNNSIFISVSNSDANGNGQKSGYESAGEIDLYLTFGQQHLVQFRNNSYEHTEK